MEVMFKPSDSDEGYFYRVTSDIAPTKTLYDLNTNQFTIEIETGLVDDCLKCNVDICTENNRYISKYMIVQRDDKTCIVLTLRAAAKNYSIQKGKVPDDTGAGFPYFWVEFRG